jgi:hypothetical protein
VQEVPAQQGEVKEEQGAARQEERFSALSPRALLVGLVCVAITCVVVCYAELVVGKIMIGFLQLPPVVVGMLVMLLAAQAALKRLSPRLKLRPHEMFTIYIMMVLASMVSSRGLLEKLIPLLVTPNYQANATNNWAALFFKFIPRWAVPWNPAGPEKQFAAQRFFDALRPGEHIPWQLWITPLLAWGLFVALMFTAYLCLAVILRRQWADNEKLAFPLVQLPLEMVRADTGPARGAAGGSFLRNRLTWFGFALPALLFGFNGLHQWYPSVPEFTTDLNLNAFLQQPPWNNITYFHVYLSFAAVGFFYLLATDLLFSLWFFFLLTILADGIASSLGYVPETLPMYGCKVYLGYQIIGCYIVLVGYMFYAARPHLARVWRSAMSTTPPYPPLRKGGVGGGRAENDEVLSYRAAFWGLVLSILLSAGWLTMLGMTYWLALFELAVLLFVVALVMARSTCESGMLMTETSFRPIDVYRMFGDVRNLGGANLTSLAFLDALWMRDQRGLILTGFLDGMKFSDGARVRRRSLLGVFVIALVVALGVSGSLHIWLPYNYGAVQMYGYVYQGNPVWAFTDSATVLNGSRPPLPWFATMNFVIGMLVTFAIVALRARLLWFPLHPLGYALCGTWTMMVFWFPCFVAWLCKIIILRYGGMQLYAKARPFFLGMVLGEFTMAVLFTLPALYDRFTPTPAFPWP